MENLQKELKNLFQIVQRIETEYAKYNRKFTIDGHLIGSIGEVLAAEAFNLKLAQTGMAVYDATRIEKPDETVQIKATQIDRVSFSPVREGEAVPDYVIVIQINKSGDWEPIYYGPGKNVYDLLALRKTQKNGQIQITLTKLRELNASVSDKLLSYSKP